MKITKDIFVLNSGSEKWIIEKCVKSYKCTKYPYNLDFLNFNQIFGVNLFLFIMILLLFLIS